MRQTVASKLCKYLQSEGASADKALIIPRKSSPTFFLYDFRHSQKRPKAVFKNNRFSMRLTQNLKIQSLLASKSRALSFIITTFSKTQTIQVQNLVFFSSSSASGSFDRLHRVTKSSISTSQPPPKAKASQQSSFCSEKRQRMKTQRDDSSQICIIFNMQSRSPKLQNVQYRLIPCCWGIIFYMRKEMFSRVSLSNRLSSRKDIRTWSSPCSTIFMMSLQQLTPLTILLTSSKVSDSLLRVWRLATSEATEEV